MIRNIYFKCETCGNVETRFMDDAYKDNVKLIHRIINIENMNGEIRYYTKGDANTNVDDGYIIKDDIIGTTLFKIKYIGYPSLWLRDIFED